MTVFTTAFRDIAADPNFGEAASYLPQAGGSVAVTVVRSRRPVDGLGADMQGHAGQEVAEVAREALAGVAVARGDRLAVGGVTYWVEAVQADETADSWRLDLAAQG